MEDKLSKNIANDLVSGKYKVIAIERKEKKGKEVIIIEIEKK